MGLAAQTPETKRLVFITPGPLLPITNGQRSTAFQLICELSRIAEIECTLVLQPNASEVDVLQTINELRKYGVTTNRIQTYSWSTLKSLVRFCVSQISRPLCKLLFPEPLLAINAEESVLFFGSTFDPMAQVVGERSFKERFFFPADSIALYQANTQSNSFAARLSKWVKVYLSKHLERGVTKLYDRSFYVSSRDAEYLKSFASAAKAEIVPIGTRPPIKGKEYQLSSANRLIFTGVMNYTPNLEAARFLISAVMPLLKDTNIVLVLAGLNPPAELYTLAAPLGERVKILGAVPSIEDEILASDLYVSPLFSGAGAKNKVLTALGCGVPVLGTAESFSGFSASPTGGLISEKTAVAFANGIRSFLNLPLNEKSALGNAARRFIIDKCSWATSARQLLSKL
jgi:glycosyltransferase involved in cell wall biosynthesis